MAGLLRLLTPYHRHRKRLTAKNATPEASPPPPPPPPEKKKPAAAPLAPVVVVPAKPQPQPSASTTGVRRRRSCEAPRSPTIAPEYRRASCDSPRPPPPAIVARLMGLEESAPPSPAAVTPRPRPVLPTRPPPPPPPPEMAAEKRRKLLGALERCDEDLKTLRRIIAAVRAAEMRSVPDVVGSVPAGAGKEGVIAEWMDGEPTPAPKHEKAARAEEECYPSPDSVLDAITSPRFPCRKRPPPPRCTLPDADSKPSCAAVVSRIVKPSRTLVFSGDYCKIKQYCNELHAVAMHHPPPAASMPAEGIIPRWTPSAAEAESWRHRRRWGLQAAGSAVRSRAMVESVVEVWGQGAGGERWEAGLVGVALERAILQDLVQDAVAELLAQSGPDAPAPYGHGQEGGGATCRKRLCF